MTLLRDHLTRLADFSGRENRQPFWLWILTVYLVQMVLSMLGMIPLMMRMMSGMQVLAGRDQAYLDAHPEFASQVMMGVMGPFLRDLMIFTAASGLLSLALIAAAVVRRLHDGDRSGWWAAPVLAVQIATPLAYWAMLPRFFTQIGSMGSAASPDQVNAVMSSILPGFALIGLLGMLGFVFMILLIIFLAQRGTVGPNCHGPDLLPPPVPTQVVTAPPMAAAATQPRPRARVVKSPERGE